MRSSLHKAVFASVASAMALFSTAGHSATVQSWTALQAPKTPLTGNPSPPSLNSDVTAAMSAFYSGYQSIGSAEFEGNNGATNGSTSFSYTGGTATLSGGGTVVGASVSTPVNGRYNMTTGVVGDTSNNNVASGHWLDASSTFTYTFSSAIYALSFFATDLGDFRGQLVLTLYSGTTEIFNSGYINNPLPNTVGNPNGNLTYFALRSDTGITSAKFTITQGAGVTSPDVIGFDSILVAGPIASTPEPTSLALVGLGAVAAGLAMRKRKQA